MPGRDSTFFEGVTGRDVLSLKSILDGKNVAPDLVGRLRDRGWIEARSQGYLLTWAGRCVIETPVTH